MARPRSELPFSRVAVDRAIALDASGSVPCTCSAIRAALGGVRPSSSFLGWHYDACERTVAAMREDGR